MNSRSTAQLSTVSLQCRPHLSGLKSTNTGIVTSYRVQTPVLKGAEDALEGRGQPPSSMHVVAFALQDATRLAIATVAPLAAPSANDLLL